MLVKEGPYPSTNSQDSGAWDTRGMRQRALARSQTEGLCHIEAQALHKPYKCAPMSQSASTLQELRHLLLCTTRSIQKPTTILEKIEYGVYNKEHSGVLSKIISYLLQDGCMLLFVNFLLNLCTYRLLPIATYLHIDTCVHTAIGA